MKSAIRFEISVPVTIVDVASAFSRLKRGEFRKAGQGVKAESDDLLILRSPRRIDLLG